MTKFLMLRMLIFKIAVLNIRLYEKLTPNIVKIVDLIYNNLG